MSKFQNYFTTPASYMKSKWHYELNNSLCKASEVRKELRKHGLRLRNIKKLQERKNIHAAYAAGCEVFMWKHR